MIKITCRKIYLDEQTGFCRKVMFSVRFYWISDYPDADSNSQMTNIFPPSALSLTLNI